MTTASPTLRPAHYAPLLAERAAPTSPAVAELGALGRLAAPLLLANLGQVMLCLAESVVVGRLGAFALGAAGLGGTLFFTVAVPATGLLLGFEPLIAQAVGAGDLRQARRHAGASLGLALALALPLALAGVWATSALPALGIPETTAAAVRGYVGIRLCGLVPHLGFVALRAHAQATGRASAVLGAAVAANAMYLPLAAGLVFGDGAAVALGLPAMGLPALGLAGAALASVAASTVATVALAVTGGHAGEILRSCGRVAPWTGLGLGLPIALGMLAEQGSFTLASLLVAGLVPGALGAHQVAMTYAGSVYLAPLALGAAAAVRVGVAVGRGDAAAALRAGLGAAFGAAALTGLVGGVFLVCSPALARLLTGDPAVIDGAAELLAVAAAFVIVDGVQVTLVGALRGLGDTRFACGAQVVGHYAVGLPLGVGCATWGGMGAAGLWWGMTAGFSVVVGALGVRFAMVGGRGGSAPLLWSGAAGRETLSPGDHARGRDGMARLPA